MHFNEHCIDKHFTRSDDTNYERKTKVRQYYLTVQKLREKDK